MCLVTWYSDPCPTWHIWHIASASLRCLHGVYSVSVTCMSRSNKVGQSVSWVCVCVHVSSLISIRPGQVPPWVILSYPATLIFGNILSVAVRFFSEKISKNHTLRTFLRGGTLVLPHSGGCAVLVRHLVLHHYFGYCSSRKCHWLIINIGTFVMYLVDLGAYYRFKGH